MWRLDLVRPVWKACTIACCTVHCNRHIHRTYAIIIPFPQKSINRIEIPTVGHHFD